MVKDVSGRALAALGALAVGLGVAFLLVPRALAAGAPGGFTDQRALVDALRVAFVDYWNSGRRGFPPDLARVQDYWLRYLVARTAIAALLLIVLTALAVLLWKALVGAGDLARGTSAALASAWALTTVLVPYAVWLLGSNLRAAVAPFASLISILPFGTRDPRFTAATAQIRAHLTGYHSGDPRNPPPLEAMVGDYVRFHVTMAVFASATLLAMIALSAAASRRFARTGSSGRRARRALAWVGVISALTALAATVFLVANVATVAKPIPPFRAVFGG